MRLKHSIYWVVCALVGTGLALAQSNAKPPVPGAAPPEWFEEQFTATPQELQAALSTMQAPAGADTVIFYEHRSILFDEQDRRTTRLHRVYQTRTAAGVENWGSTEERWEPWHEAAPTLRARVITPDGMVRELDPTTIAELPVGEGNGTLSDARLLRAPLPGMAPGAIVEEFTEVVETQPLIAGGRAGRVNLGSLVPVEHSRVTLKARTSVDLRYQTYLLDGASEVRTEEDGMVRIEITAGRLEGITQVDPYLPPEVPFQPEVNFSTGRSWPSVAGAYQQAVAAQIKGDEVQVLVDAAGIQELDRKGVAATLLALLHEQVRYTGIEFADAAIIPRTPAEILERQYGDCKDQAALLVAMLRAAGIPAHLALLDAGYGRDIDPALPGFGMFNHAIVYVPGDEPLWIDTTDPYARVNELPIPDRDRWALIVPEDETGAGDLIQTPEAKSSDNVLLDEREFHLAEQGDASVIEVNEPTGSIERTYRNSFSGTVKEQLGDALRKYTSSQYLSEETPRVELSDVQNVAEPMRLVVELDETGRGVTTQETAVVAIPTLSVTSRLPMLFFEENPDEDQSARSVDLILPIPYIHEMRYQITPPPGYRVSNLPESKQIQMGPALYTTDYEEAEDGQITATIRFDSGPRRYTAGQVKDARDAIAKLRDQEFTVVRFDQVGQTLLNAGKVREALAEFRSLTELHPDEALHHAQISKALLVAGAGEEAQVEARRAIELDPASADGYVALAWALQHDEVGRRFKPGMDLDGAEEAYRKALELDPGNDAARMALAILLESKPSGRRYRDEQNVRRAAEEYSAVSKEFAPNVANNLAAALMWSHQWARLLEYLDEQKPTDGDIYAVLAVGAMDGIHAALAEANRRFSTDQARRQALARAAETFIVLRMYDLAADLLEVAAQGNTQAATLRTRIDTLHRLEHYEDHLGPATTPRDAVTRFMVLAMSPESSDEELLSAVTKDSLLRRPEVLKQMRRVARSSVAQLLTQGVSLEVGMDAAISEMQVALDGDDDTGYRARVSISGNDSIMLVGKEGKEYKVFGEATPGIFGAHVLDLAEAGDLDTARLWLDWARETQSLVRQEDPLQGPVFPRLWTKGQEATGTQIQAAAAALAIAEEADRAVPILEAAFAAAKDPDERLGLQIALANAYMAAQENEKALSFIETLLEQYPDSTTAAGSYAEALLLAGRAEESLQVIADFLQRHPDDMRARIVQTSLAGRAGEYQKDIDLLTALDKEGRSNPALFNNLAWLYLVEGEVTDDVVRIAQRAVQGDGGKSYPSLQTLAAIYAERGQAAEARQLILQGIESLGGGELVSSDWYIFGRIAEDYGLNDTARRFYARVERPESEIGIGQSNWALAQRRLTELQ